MGKIKFTKSGFTFIEILVTLGVIGFVLPVIFTIVFVIFQQQTKIYRLNEVKKQGDAVLNTSKSLIINSADIYSEEALTNQKCDGLVNTSWSSDGSTFYFKDKTGAPVRIYLSGTKIATGPTVFDITNSKVKVTNYEISCENLNTSAGPLVKLKFDIEYNTTSSRQEDKASLSYQSSYKLRN